MIRQPISIIKAIALAFGAMIAVFILKLNRLPPEIPIFYSKPDGADVLAPWYAIFILPFIMFFSIGINAVIFRLFHKENDFVSAIFYWTNILIIVFSTLIFLKIIFTVS